MPSDRSDLLPSNTDGPSARLAAFASALRFDAIPDAVIRRAEELLLDWLGSALAGKGAPPVEAITRFALSMAPADGPSTHVVCVAIPLAFVTTVAVATLPPPEVTVNVTATPATGLPAKSLTITEGGMLGEVPCVAVWLLPALTVSDTAAPAVPCDHVVATGAKRCENDPSPVLNPQQYGCPPAVRPHAELFRVRMEANATLPSTGVGVDRSMSVPSPTAPEPL